MSMSFFASVTGTFVCNFSVDSDDPKAAREEFLRRYKELNEEDRIAFIVNAVSVINGSGEVKVDSGVSELKR